MYDIASPLRGNGFTAPLPAINTPKTFAKFIRGIGEGISMVGASLGGGGGRLPIEIERCKWRAEHAGGGILEPQRLR